MKKLLWGILSGLVFLCQVAPARTFRIAGLYPATNLGHPHCTCGLEAACVTKAAVSRAQKEGIDVSLDLIDKDWTPIATGEAALKTVQGAYDAAVGTIVSADALVAARILEKAEIPLVVPLATNPLVTEGFPIQDPHPLVLRRPVEDVNVQLGDLSDLVAVHEK